MDGQETQRQTESSDREVHCTQRLHLFQLQVRNQSPGAIRRRPWNLASSRRVQRQVEVRTRIELVEVSLPCFHVASTHKEVERMKGSSLVTSSG